MLCRVVRYFGRKRGLAEGRYAALSVKINRKDGFILGARLEAQVRRCSLVEGCYATLSGISVGNKA